MRVLYSPANDLLDFDKEANVPSFSALSTPYGKLFYLPGEPNMRKVRGKAQDMSSPIPVSAGCGSLEDQQLAQFAPIPISTMSSVHAAGIQAIDVAPFHEEHLVPLLVPDRYATDQRSSTIADSINSLYAWSSTSEAAMLTSEAHSVEPSFSNSPFMQSYYTSGPSQPSLSQSNHGVSGYSPQQIDRCCMESGPVDNLSLQTTPYPAMNTLAYPSIETQPSVYPADEIGEPMSTDDQWHSQVSFVSLPSTTTALPTEAFLAPRSAPAVSIDSSSAMSTSPVPTLSDIESSSTSRQGPSSPPSNPADLTRYGIPAGDGVWRCAHPRCTSQAMFRRGCDLRKHFNRHRKHLFCRHEGCPQSKQGGFSSKKDRARHEAKHNPGIVCEWDGCGRVFSRVDNMKDHVRRIHRGGSR